MYQRLTKALLSDIYYPVSAAISIGEREEILGVHLFDTMHFGGPMRVAPNAAELWLISHHGDGVVALYEADLENLRQLHRLAGGRRVRMFLSVESGPCREIGLSETLMDVL